MDVRFRLLLICLWTLCHPAPGLSLQSHANGMSLHARQLHFAGSRQLLPIKVQDGKGQPKSKADKQPVDNTGHEASTVNKAESGNKGTDATSPPPHPPAKPEGAQTALGKEIEDTNSTFNPEKRDDQKKDNSAQSGNKPNALTIHCGESHCEDPKKSVSACLRIPGDGTHKLSLFITNGGDSEVLVKVIAPEYLTADPSEVSVLKDKSETVQFLMKSEFEPSSMDVETEKKKNITVITDNNECEIAVPLDYIRSLVPEHKVPFSSYLPSVTPKMIAYLVAIVFVMVLVGALLWYKCYRKKRVGDVKYQQLEMLVPGQSTPKERDEQSSGAWDEVWDDDWEDAEAAKSSSRLSQNLSSRGLGGRRGNRDGWNSSWDD